MAALVQSAPTTSEKLLAPTPKEATPDKKNIPLKSLVEKRENVLALQKNMAPFIGKFMQKLSGSFDPGTRITMPDGKAFSFHGEEIGENGDTIYEFIVGANTRLKLPLSFIYMILEEKTITDQYMELFIREWSVNLDGQDIPMIAWIDENSGETLAKVLTQAQKRTQKALEKGKKPNPVDDFKIRSVRQFMNILAGKPHDNSDENIDANITKRRVHVTQINKRPTITIGSRNMS